MDFTRTHLIFSRLTHLVADTVLGRVNEDNRTCYANRQRNQTSQVLAVWEQYLTTTITPNWTTKPDKRPCERVDSVDAHLTNQQRIQWKLDQQQRPTDSSSQLRTLHSTQHFYREVERQVHRYETEQRRQLQRQHERRVQRLRQTVRCQRNRRQQWQEWGERWVADLYGQRESKRVIRTRRPNQIRMSVRPSPVVPPVAPVVAAPVVEEGYYVEVPRRRRKNKKKWVGPGKGKRAGGS